MSKLSGKDNIYLTFIYFSNTYISGIMTLIQKQNKKKRKKKIYLTDLIQVL